MARKKQSLTYLCNVLREDLRGLEKLYRRVYLLFQEIGQILIPQPRRSVSMDEPKVPKCTCLVGMRSIHRPGCIHALVEQQQDKPEPDVLERLKDWKAEYLKLASGSPTDNYISPMAARKVAEELTDAIAEIEKWHRLCFQAQDSLMAIANKCMELEAEIERLKVLLETP